MTGYTNILVEKDLDFGQFVWLCVRAMGMAIMMRDDSLDVPVPERFEPSNYHRDEERKARDKVSRLSAMGKSEKRLHGKVIKEERLAYLKKAQAENAVPLAKMEAMRREVERWTPPTGEHDGLKKFMLQQLEDSIRFNSGEYYAKEIAATEATTPEQLVDEELKKAQSDVEYHVEEYAKELARTDECNRWLAQLRAAVPQRNH